MKYFSLIAIALIASLFSSCNDFTERRKNDAAIKKGENEINRVKAKMKAEMEATGSYSEETQKELAEAFDNMSQETSGSMQKLITVVSKCNATYEVDCKDLYAQIDTLQRASNYETSETSECF